MVRVGVARVYEVPLPIAFLTLLTAVTINDKATGLKLALPSELCVYVPSELRDASACANTGDTAALVRPSGTPVRVIAQAIEKQQSGMAHTTVIAIALEAADHATAEDLDSFITGMARSVAKVNNATAKIRGFDSEGKYDLLRVGAQPVVRFALLLEASGSRATQVCFLVPAGNEMLAVVLSSNEVGVEALKPLADAILPTIRMPNANTDTFGKSKAEQQSNSNATLIGLVVGALGAAALALWFLRRRKR